MSHPLVWPGSYFFYPIGNTSAVCLTRDLPSEEDADILLLGCGDPRHVLYTVFSELETCEKLDFTCCDFDPGVLARNALLLTLIADDVAHQTLWNIFYHLHLDANSLAVLRSHCQKLVDASADLESWRLSPYGPFLHFSTEYTLSELRRHWSLYHSMQNLPPHRLSAIREAYGMAFKSSQRSRGTPMTAARAAGPLIARSSHVSAEQVKNYWKTGTTFFDVRQISLATFLNPTFAYCLLGEGCNVHYASDPLVTFHSAEVFGNSVGDVQPGELVKAARSEFSVWCRTFRESLTTHRRSPCVRMCLAEATAFCKALRGFRASHMLNPGIPIAQFKTQLLRLFAEEYVDGGAPAAFNVIETSNLIDHVGLLNVLIAAAPLLAPSPTSVLYTESLVFLGDDATKEFANLLYADIGTVGLLLDLCPIDYLSGFTSRSNTHELLAYQAAQGKVGQFQQVTTWKRPMSSDSDVALHGSRSQLPPVFESRQLGTLLFDMYHAIFEQEDAPTFLQENLMNLRKAIATSNIIHYMREGFVLLLRSVRERLRIPREQWLEVMDRFLDLEGSDRTMPMNTINRNDLYAHLHRQGVHTLGYYKTDRLPRIGRFAGWDAVPPVVRIILSVPREKITAFESVVRTAKSGTPLLHCDVRGNRCHNTFGAVHVAFGRILSTGTRSSPRVLFEEDTEGWKGSLPLVASFCLPSMLLTHFEPPSNLRVCLSVRCTTGTATLIPHLGLNLEVFGAALMDEDHVFVVPEAALPPEDFESSLGPLPSPNSSMRIDVGTQQAVHIDFDEQCELVQTLSSKVAIEHPDVKREFGSAGAMPHIRQLSPCCMRLTVAGHSQDVVFPFPVIGTQNKLRLARKSLYIEVRWKPMCSVL
ncbi:hypothetical protein C8Q77DRAFT_1062112 [Trametes polyzona]|nr:hypothetical protein C8Q77DRAFT_1062112 [Trametes polyzona]